MRFKRVSASGPGTVGPSADITPSAGESLEASPTAVASPDDFTSTTFKGCSRRDSPQPLKKGVLATSVHNTAANPRQMLARHFRAILYSPLRSAVTVSLIPVGYPPSPHSTRRASGRA